MSAGPGPSAPAGGQLPAPNAPGPGGGSSFPCPGTASPLAMDTPGSGKEHPDGRTLSPPVCVDAAAVGVRGLCTYVALIITHKAL